MGNTGIKFDFNNMMSDFIGDKGIKEDDIQALKGKIESAHKAMIEKRASGQNGLA